MQFLIDVKITKLSGTTTTREVSLWESAVYIHNQMVL